jgi:hypothetical protein
MEPESFVFALSNGGPLRMSQLPQEAVEAWAGLTSVSFTPALPIPSRSVNSSS